MPEKRSALGTKLWTTHTDKNRQLCISEIAAAAIVEIAGWQDSFVTDVAPLLGRLVVNFPASFRSVEFGANGIEVFRISSRKLLLFSWNGDLWQECRSLIDENNLSVTNLGDSRAIMRINGTAVGELLARLFPIDFYPGVFPENCFVQSAVHGVPAMVRRRADSASGMTFDVIVPRSYAVSVYDWIKLHTLPLRDIVECNEIRNRNRGLFADD